MCPAMRGACHGNIAVLDETEIIRVYVVEAGYPFCYSLVKGWPPGRDLWGGRALVL